VHLTPPGTIEETTKKFRELGFKVVPGGTHTRGLTENALVVFQDDVYLELISFTHLPSHYPPSSPERHERESHYWASKNPGWIDFAFLGNSTTSISKIINERANEDGSGVEYSPEEKGGRERPDGKVLEWVISAPVVGHGRGSLPFFCGDITSRKWRVPVDPPSNTQHPSTASGVAYVRTLVDEKAFAAVSDQLTSVIGSQPIIATATDTTWVLDTPSTIGRTEHEKPRLILSVPKGNSEHEVLKKSGPGIYEVGFWVNDGGGSIGTPYGKIVWCPVGK